MSGSGTENEGVHPSKYWQLLLKDALISDIHPAR